MKQRMTDARSLPVEIRNLRKTFRGPDGKPYFFKLYSLWDCAKLWYCYTARGVPAGRKTPPFGARGPSIVGFTPGARDPGTGEKEGFFP